MFYRYVSIFFRGVSAEFKFQVGLVVGVRYGMDVVLDAGMSGRWCLVFSLFSLVTKVFGFIISKGRGPCYS